MADETTNEGVDGSSVDGSTESNGIVGDKVDKVDDTSAPNGNPDDSVSKDTATDVDTVSPETYSDFTLPEDINLDEGALDKAKPIFAELGLNQEQAQKLVDLQAEMVKGNVTAQTESHDSQVAAWQEEAKADKEFGGDNFDESLGVAKKALETFADDAFKEVLDSTGLGNHPAVIRTMWKIGKTLLEDVPGSTGGNSSTPKDRVSQLYPT